MTEKQSAMSIFKLSNANYDRLRVITQFWLPALGTFYYTIAMIWNLPFGEQVVATVTALVLLFGIILGVSNTGYKKSGARYDGDLVIDTTDPDKDVFSLQVNTHPLDLVGKDEIILKVQGS